MPLKIVLVGAGHMGRIHLEKLVSMEDVRVSGIVDADPTRTLDLAGAGHIPCFTDYRDAVGEADGVVIATPTESHYEIGKAFLRNGCHLFMEKPVTSDVKEAEELIALAKEKSCIFQVGHLERFNPPFAKGAGEITKPLYIEARRVSPFTGRSTDITVVLDVMIHDIDLVLSLAKARVKSVRAQGQPFLSEKIDMANAWIEFENGCVANLTASRVADDRERSIMVFEKERYFFMNLLAGRLAIGSRGPDGNMEIAEYETAKVDAVKYELAEFIESIKGKRTPSVTGEDGLNALNLARLIEQYIVAGSHS